MRNKRLWNLCMLVVCLQCAVCPMVETLADADAVLETAFGEEQFEQATLEAREALKENPIEESVAEMPMTEETQAEEPAIAEPSVEVPKAETPAAEVPIEAEAVEEESTAIEVNSVVIPLEVELVNISPFTASRKTIVPEIVLEGNAISAENVTVILKDSEGKTLTQDFQVVEEEGKLTCKLEEIEEDGRYTLVVEGADDYGNQTTKTCTFTVNKHGSVFTHDEDCGYIPTIKIHNYDDVKIISCMVNGKEAEYSWDGEYVKISDKYLNVGKNLITLETKDGAGNISSMEPWEIMVNEEKDQTKPSVVSLKSQKSFSLFVWRICKKLLSI